jgi:hypothetical protein
MAGNVEVVPFAMVPKWLVCSTVSDRAVRLFARIYLYGGEDHETTLKRRTLADELGVSVDSIDRALAELAKAGAVRIEETVADSGDRGPNRYHVWPEVPSGGGRTRAAPIPRGSRKAAATVAARVPRQEVESPEVESNDLEKTRAAAGAAAPGAAGATPHPVNEADASSSPASKLSEARPNRARKRASGSRNANPEPRTDTPEGQGGTGPAELPGMPPAVVKPDPAGDLLREARARAKAEGRIAPTTAQYTAKPAVAAQLAAGVSPEDVAKMLDHAPLWTRNCLDLERGKLAQGVNGYAGKPPPAGTIRHPGARRGSAAWADSTDVQPAPRRAKAVARD